MPHTTQLSPGRSALLVVDVQEKLMVKIPSAQAIIRNIGFLIDAARLLELPVSATEQYPKGLGPTVAGLVEKLPNRPEKLAFSSCGVPAVVDGFRQQNRTQILVTGIESHVCILHTTLDLLSAGFHVFLPVDALGSRYPLDHDVALRRLEKAGAILTTTETTAFEWVGGASHPKFKSISMLVQERMKAM
jgi:nicotinamidase-related amidase